MGTKKLFILQNAAVKRSADLYYWYNYVWINGKKIGTNLMSDVESIFITDRTGFNLDFLIFVENN